jgi:NAD(P)-dependent dehydrogenase (short-subunit alcohol dehydrogenase family)
MSDRLQGKIAIVTGGASGIGLEIAKGFGQQGARVCIADVLPAACDEAALSVSNGAFGHVLDVRDRRSMDQLVSDVVAKAGGIDILVNCAGVFGMQAFTAVTEQEFDRIFAVNARGLLFITQTVARQMISQGRGGAIVCIASGAGRRGSPGAAVYSASKAAVISLTQSAAQELIPHGIRVNAIAPGATRTPMWADVEKQFSKTLGLQTGGAEAAQVAVTPAARLAKAEEMVGAAVFLASAESSYVVGQTLNVDGGMYLN